MKVWQQFFLGVDACPDHLNMLDQFFLCFANANCRSQVDPLRLPPQEYSNLDWRKLCWTNRLSRITHYCTRVFFCHSGFSNRAFKSQLAENPFNPWFEGVFEHREEAPGCRGYSFAGCRSPFCSRSELLYQSKIKYRDCSTLSCSVSRLFPQPVASVIEGSPIDLLGTYQPPLGSVTGTEQFPHCTGDLWFNDQNEYQMNISINT